MSTDTFTRDWQDWKTQRERDLADPLGWLALVSLDWLEDKPRAYEGLPGLWWQDADAAYLDPQGADLSHEGERVTGVRRFELVNSGATTRVVAGDIEIEVARRGGYLIRTHDPKAPVLNAFRGVPAYEPDAAWVLSGTFEPFDEPRPTTVGAVVEGLSHVYVSPGIVRFEHDGAEHTLTAFNGKKDGLLILFTDATSGVTTYAANRSLAVPARRISRARSPISPLARCRRTATICRSRWKRGRSCLTNAHTEPSRAPSSPPVRAEPARTGGRTRPSGAGGHRFPLPA